MLVQAGNISNENAERRADMPGKPNFAEANAFDGPGPETINGRLVRAGWSACCWLWCLSRSLRCLFENVLAEELQRLCILRNVVVLE